MPNYDIHVFCDECGVPHPMRIKIFIPGGPAEKESIGNVYAGEKLPSEIGRLLNNYVRCPKTGKLYKQTNNDLVFLVALPEE